MTQIPCSHFSQLKFFLIHTLDYFIILIRTCKTSPNCSTASLLSTDIFTSDNHLPKHAYHVWLISWILLPLLGYICIGPEGNSRKEFLVRPDPLIYFCHWGYPNLLEPVILKWILLTKFLNNYGTQNWLFSEFIADKCINPTGNYWSHSNALKVTKSKISYPSSYDVHGRLHPKLILRRTKYLNRCLLNYFTQRMQTVAKTCLSENQNVPLKPITQQDCHFYNLLIGFSNENSITINDGITVP